MLWIVKILITSLPVIHLIDYTCITSCYSISLHVYNLDAKKVAIRCKSDPNNETIIKNTNVNFLKIVNIQKHILVPCYIFNAHGIEHITHHLKEQVPIKHAIKTSFQVKKHSFEIFKKVSESHLHIMLLIGHSSNYVSMDNTFI